MIHWCLPPLSCSIDLLPAEKRTVVEYYIGNSETTTLLPSAKCTRPLFQGRTGCGGRASIRLAWYRHMPASSKYLWKANLPGTGSRSEVLCNYDDVYWGGYRGLAWVRVSTLCCCCVALYLGQQGGWAWLWFPAHLWISQFSSGNNR